MRIIVIAKKIDVELRKNNEKSENFLCVVRDLRTFSVLRMRRIP